MPQSLIDKLGKYTTKRKDFDVSVEGVFQELKNKAEHLTSRGLSLKFLADDFFEGTVGNLYVSKILNGSITPYHNHDFYELNYIISGECAQHIDGQNMIMEAGDLLLLPPDVYHASCPVGDGVGMNILVKAEFLHSLEEKFKKIYKSNYLTFLRNNKVYMLFRGVKDNKAAEAAADLINEVKNKNTSALFRSIYLENLASNFFIELTDIDRSDIMFQTESHRIGEKNIEIILQYISDNIADVTLEKTSRYFGYSGTHLSKSIKKHTGNSFISYVTSQRILKSEYLLAKSDIPISNIPQMVGLDSNEYFFRMFKRINGITPLEYRKMSRNRAKKQT